MAIRIRPILAMILAYLGYVSALDVSTLLITKDAGNMTRTHAAQRSARLWI